MEKREYLIILYDFYSELLSDKQKDELKSAYKKIIEDVNKKENSKCIEGKPC